MRSSISTSISYFCVVVPLEINDNEDSEAPADELDSESEPASVVVKETPLGEATDQLKAPSERQGVTVSSPSSNA